jgi:hypothetical protein
VVVVRGECPAEQHDDDDDDDDDDKVKRLSVYTVHDWACAQ